MALKRIMKAPMPPCVTQDIRILTPSLNPLPLPRHLPAWACFPFLAMCSTGKYHRACMFSSSTFLSRAPHLRRSPLTAESPPPPRDLPPISGGIRRAAQGGRGHPATARGHPATARRRRTRRRRTRRRRRRRRHGPSRAIGGGGAVAADLFCRRRAFAPAGGRRLRELRRAQRSAARTPRRARTPDEQTPDKSATLTCEPCLGQALQNLWPRSPAPSEETRALRESEVSK